MIKKFFYIVVMKVRYICNKIDVKLELYTNNYETFN